ncbi:penicillin-binding protein 2 [Albidovulum inexpectatum]|uniref:Penicillin-binding protein 2 n=1 Tax=Albidovulum inexpectatum TaxID=196587 RepID=A0A2S5JKS3_9RHOB|nr:penicillin-binding protein 2 [Albidovulum inexpectatum]PPB82106.1 penicillin-binding protein 2 [Albidovulum inexpectatum]
MKRAERQILESHRRIGRRAMMLGGIQAALIGTLALRLQHLQLDQADQFRLLAEENAIKVRLIPPVRGLILDRRGTIVAGNEQNYRVTVIADDAGDLEAVLDRLARLIPLDPEDRARTIKEARRTPTLPVTVADRLTWEEFSRVAVNSPALPGITTEVGLSRNYPFGPDFAHVLGYVGPVSDYDLSRIEDPDPLLRIPRFQIGKLGVEAKLETLLRGKAGSRRVEVNAAGRVMRELGRKEGDPGANVQLTIDHRLQNFVQARLGDESAAAVVIDIQTGDIVAINSSPSFDPNLFVRGISSADYRALMENDHRPLADKTVQGAYPPGSTFKMITAMAALEAGVISPGETVYCPGYTTLGNRRFHCWRRGGHGEVSLTKSLEQSCDVYYYEIAQRVGIERIAEMARRMGIGTRFDLPMSAISEGLAPDREWKRAKYGTDWLIGDTLNTAIGQGFVLASPLQLAVMTARLASGKAITPRLVRAIDGVEQPVMQPGDLGVSDAVLRGVRKGMFEVSNSRRGTAYASRIVDDQMRMAGKTGTSQVRNITAAERARGVTSNKDLPWHRRDHALFVCFAPFDAPRYAVSVVVEHGGSGSAAAAPIARDILLQALYGGLPPLEAYPENQRAQIEEMRARLRLLPEEPAPSGGRSRA